MNLAAPEVAAVVKKQRRGGSLTQRMIGIAAIWIGVLLLLGGFALDRVLTRTIVANFDAQLENVLNGMIGASEIGPGGEVRFTRPPADQRYPRTLFGGLFPDHRGGQDPFPSRSLWDRRLKVDRAHNDIDLHKYDSDEFAGEPLRIVERDVIIPGSETQVALPGRPVARRDRRPDPRLARHPDPQLCRLGVGLLLLAALQAFYGLWPLRRVRREVAAIRSGTQTRIAENFPDEINPLVDEINDLLAHREAQAEEARRHAGNLAHALKTPLTVITNAATAKAPDLGATVCREASTMRRQVDHHLARARAIGRRASAQARARVWLSAEAVQRVIDRLYENVTIDIAGDHDVEVRVERQDLDEMLGNLVENAAKYGGGRVFVTIEAAANGFVSIVIEDDGSGIPQAQQDELFERGKRLDTTGKPGTGLGLAIVRDVAEIYGGSVTLGESEDLGGLLARLTLPAG